jgi:Linalool dehydratase/isomerase
MDAATVTTTSDEVIGGPLLLPVAPPRFGPQSRRLLARFVGAVLAVEVVGAILVFVAGGPRARAAGLSLAFPGGGFLYDAAPILFIVTVALCALAIVLWWGMSAHFAIPLVWVASVAGAVVLANGPRLWTAEGTNWDWAIPVVYAIVVASVAVAVWRVERRYRAKRALIPEINEYLAVAELPAPIREFRPPDSMDAELLRWCLSFASQPDDGLDGLDWGEQYHGGTQVRYQLNGLAWAMSLFAANFVPNAQAQAERALRSIVHKHTDLRVWQYWRTLNLVGNFDPDPDPIRRDNIMFSAFFADALNTYEAATGSTRFDEPGSLTFVWKDGRSFPYDHHSIVAAVQANFQRSKLGFFPCEPGWSFTVCNIMGAQALKGHDTTHGSDHWDQTRDRWQRTLDEEYHTPDGSYAHIRSNHVGLSWDTGEVPGGHYFAQGTHRFADILPEYARRAKALDLRGAAPKMAALAGMVKDGRIDDLDLPAEPERNLVRTSTLLPWIKVIGGAQMAGRKELADAAMRTSADRCATGERWPQSPLDVGGAGLGSYMLLRWSAPLDLAALNIRGYVPPSGPIVTDGPWDDVMVLVARSVDARSLDLQLQPFAVASTVTATLELAQLTPGGRYELVDAAGRVVTGVDADDAGRGRLVVAVDGRTALVLRPVAAPIGAPS